MKKESQVLGMSAQQRKYVMARAEQIKSQAESKARNELTVEGVRLSNSQKYELIAAGAVALFPKHKVMRALDSSYSFKLSKLYDFSKHETETKTDKKRLDCKLKKIGKEFQKLCDEIMLGDSSRAMKLLENFTALANSN